MALDTVQIIVNRNPARLEAAEKLDMRVELRSCNPPAQVITNVCIPKDSITCMASLSQLSAVFSMSVSVSEKRCCGDAAKPAGL